MVLHSSDFPAPTSPAMPTISPRRTWKETSLTLPSAPERWETVEDLFADGHGLLGEVLLEGAAQHLVHDFLGRGLRGDFRRIHDHAVPHDGVPLADPDDFVDPVGNKDDGDVLRGLQMLHQAEKLLGFRVGKRRGGLVQDQETAFVDDGPGDQHHLLLGQGKVLDQCMCIDLNVQTLENLGRLFVKLPPVHEIPAVHDGVIQEDVLRHGKGGDQRHIHFLIYDLDAQLFRSQRAAQVHDLVIQINLSGIIRIRAGQHLHQGGFSGAVGAHQRMDFARGHLKIHIRQGLDARKLDGDVPGSESDLFHTSILL